MQEVHSFDLVSTAPGVVACNMAAVPLDDASVDAAIFCLALMGTDYGSFLQVKYARSKHHRACIQFYAGSEAVQPDSLTRQTRWCLQHREQHITKLQPKPASEPDPVILDSLHTHNSHTTGFAGTGKVLRR